MPIDKVLNSNCNFVKFFDIERNCKQMRPQKKNLGFATKISLFFKTLAYSL